LVLKNTFDPKPLFIPIFFLLINQNLYHSCEALLGTLVRRSQLLSCVLGSSEPHGSLSTPLWDPTVGHQCLGM
jgi:hypothetical protein